MFLMRTFKVNVNPEIIKWSIKNINMPEEVIIKKIGITKNIFDKWINNLDKPTYIQLQKLAKNVRVSPLIFLSDKPPNEEPMRVFRTYNNTDQKSYDTLLMIKRITFLQDVVYNLYNNLNLRKEANIERYSIKTNPKEIAENERKKFFDLDNQLQSKTKYDVLRKFRTQVEDNNILVMQFPFEDIRGLSLIDKNPYIIVLNSRDDPTSRIFTLFHEYAHILLGINELDEDSNYSSSDKIEKWCNNFASYFLISDDRIKQYVDKFDNIDKIATSISNRYKLSYSMIFYRLYKLNYIQSYETEYDKFIKKKEQIKNTTSSGGNYIVNIKTEYGNKFINIVNENYEKGEITLNEALTYLGIKIKTYDKLMEASGLNCGNLWM